VITSKTVLLWSLVSENLKQKHLCFETEMDTSFVVIAIVATLALLGVIAITVVTVPVQQAEAKSITSLCASTIRNASASLCPKGT
jgi:hypothetical protein